MMMIQRTLFCAGYLSIPFFLTTTTLAWMVPTTPYSTRRQSTNRTFRSSSSHVSDDVYPLQCGLEEEEEENATEEHVRTACFLPLPATTTRRCFAQKLVGMTLGSATLPVAAVFAEEEGAATTELPKAAAPAEVPKPAPAEEAPKPAPIEQAASEAPPKPVAAPAETTNAPTSDTNKAVDEHSPSPSSTETTSNPAAPATDEPGSSEPKTATTETPSSSSSSKPPAAPEETTKETAASSSTPAETKPAVEAAKKAEEPKTPEAPSAAPNNNNNNPPTEQEYKAQVKELVKEMLQEEKDETKADLETEALLERLEVAKEKQQESGGVSATPAEQKEQKKDVATTKQLIGQLEKDEEKVEEETEELITKLEQLKQAAEQVQEAASKKPLAKSTTPPSTTSDFLSQLRQRLQADKDYVSLLDYQKREYGSEQEDFFQKWRILQGGDGGSGNNAQEELEDFFTKLKERVEANKEFKTLYDEFLTKLKGST